jgi:hypothetical protein
VSEESLLLLLLDSASLLLDMTRGSLRFFFVGTGFTDAFTFAFDPCDLATGWLHVIMSSNG